MSLRTDQTATPVVPRHGRLRPLSVREVTITGGFWGRRQEVNGAATLAHVEQWLERVGWLGNFDLAAAGGLPEGRRGREFSDSEVYKFLEALAWEIGRDGSTAEALDARFRAVVRAGRRRPGTRRLPRHDVRPPRAGGALVRAGVGPRALLLRPPAPGGGRAGAHPARTPTTASSRSRRRAADLVCEVFGAGGIESRLRARRDRARARRVRPRHRRAPLPRAGRAVRRAPRARRPARHRVRPRLLPGRRAGAGRRRAARARRARRATWRPAPSTSPSSTDDDELLAALVTQWENTVARRTYLTGGQGSHHQDEAFGDDWVLPPDRAYSETCAAVASIMFSWRLLLATGAPRYADLIERTLFNVVATSPSARGRPRSSTPTRCTSGEPGDPAGDEDGLPAGVVVAAGAVVRGVVLPAERGPHVREPRRVPRDRGRRRACSCTSTRPAAIRTTLADGTAVALDVATALPARRARPRARPRGRRRRRGRSRCGCRRGRAARGSS